MRPIRTHKSKIENLTQKHPALLKRAKRGDRTAKKELRQMGLVYWEHSGRVILTRVQEDNSKRNGATPWSFAHAFRNWK